MDRNNMFWSCKKHLVTGVAFHKKQHKTRFWPSSGLANIKHLQKQSKKLVKLLVQNMFFAHFNSQDIICFCRWFIKNNHYCVYEMSFFWMQNNFKSTVLNCFKCCRIIINVLGQLLNSLFYAAGAGHLQASKVMCVLK